MVTRTQGRRPLVALRISAIAWGLAILLTLPPPPAVSEPALPELLKAFDVGRYPADTKPPKFSGRTLGGQTVSLAGLRGRVILVNFWATWCPPCREEMPMFEQLHREYAARGLTLLGVNAREGTSAVRAYAKEMGLTFPLVLDPKGKVNALYGVIGLPTTFLIGRDGQAVALAIGPREWSGAQARAILEALLAEPVGPVAR
jgi:peroxiredoxin